MEPCGLPQNISRLILKPQFLNFRFMMEVCWQLVSPITTVWQFIFWIPFTNMFEYLIIWFLLGYGILLNIPLRSKNVKCVPMGVLQFLLSVKIYLQQKQLHIYILCVNNVYYILYISCLHIIPFFWTGYSCKLRQVEIFKGSFVVLGYSQKSVNGLLYRYTFVRRLQYDPWKRSTIQNSAF